VATTTHSAAPTESRLPSRALHGAAHGLERLAVRLDGRREERPKSSGGELFWPYGTRAAIVSVVLLWVALGALAYLFHRSVGWPSQSSANHVFYVATVIGLLPLALVVLDVVARSGGAVELRGFKIDFSSSKVSTELQLTPNLGQSGPIVAVTSAANIMETLRTSVSHDAIRIDLDATWWLTRLLALSAGATRAGSPRAFVFVQSGPDGRQRFVGWAAPKTVLDALLVMESESFQGPYAEAEAIALQLAAFGPPGARPKIDMAPNVLRFLNDARYNGLGLASLEHVLIDRLAPLESEGNVATLVFPALRAQLGDALVTDRVEATDPPEDQIAALLKSSAPFIALVNGGEYSGIMRRDDAERDVLRQLAASPAT